MKRNDLRPVAAAFFILAAACGSDGKKNDAPAGPPAGALRVDPANTGNVTGRVIFAGTPPSAAPLPMASDPACVKANSGGLTSEAYLVRDGGLDNVFVYVKDGLGNYYFDVPTEPVKLDQVGCRYVPHVFG